ncbi:MAG: tetratricopeptide repeat protein [Planctomycetes bacterium]|nr:tetratricopeptide repeat protein [Planctomycetota bacterium]
MVQRRKINLRILVLLLLGAVALLGGLRAVYTFRMKANAASIYHLAQQAAQEGNQEAQVKYLSHYLALIPDDVNALAQYADLLGEAANNPKAKQRVFALLEKVIGLDPGRKDVRRKIVELAIQKDLERFKAAEEHLEILERDRPKDGQLQYLHGLCSEGLGNFQQARVHYAAAIASDKLADAYVRLAELLRNRMHKSAEAEQILENLVTAHAGSAQAWLARARFLQHYGAREQDSRHGKEMLAQARQDLQKARGHDPNNAEILLESVELDCRQGRSKEARVHLERGVAAHPKDIRFYKALARLELQENRSAKAKAVLEQGLAQAPGHFELLWSLAKLLVQGGDFAEAGKLTTQLRARGFPVSLLEALDGQILVQQGKWLAGSKALESVQPLLVQWPDVQLQTNLLLALCYEQLGDPVEQFNACRRASSIDPLSESVNLGMAAALTAMGKTDQAIETYRKVQQHSSRARYLAGLLLIRKTLDKPADQRIWLTVERYLDGIQAYVDPAEASVLRAEFLAGKGEHAEAQATLAEAVAKHPRNATLRVLQAMVAQRQNRLQDALRILDEAEQKMPDQVELRVARIRLWAEHGGPESLSALKALAADLAGFQERNRRLLTVALAEGYLHLARPRDAERLYDELAGAEPANLGVRLRLLDLAQQAGDDAAVGRWVNEIKAIEGPEGTLWRTGQIGRLLAKARRGDTLALEEAKRLIPIVAHRRGSWARVHILQGELHELSGQPEAALRSYQKALGVGDQSPVVMRRVVQLLFERRRYLEAEEVLTRLQMREEPLGVLDRIAAEIALHKHDAGKALLMAQRAVSPDSKDPGDLLWLGHILFATGRQEDAERVFRRSVEMGPRLPETWIALTQCLVRIGKRDQTGPLLDDIKSKVPADLVLLTLGQSNEILDNFAVAKDCYESALALQPTDCAVRRHLARLSLRQGQLAAAERHLTALMELKAKAPEDAAWARRILAVVMTASGDFRKTQGALAVLGILDSEITDLTKGDSQEEQRARAVVLAGQKSLTKRRQAVAILEAFPRQERLAEDQFLLAQLYDSMGDWAKVREEMMAVISVHSNNPRYLSFYTERLLQRKEWNEAEVYFRKLENCLPNSFHTLRPKALLLAGRNQGEQAVPFLTQFTRTKPETVPAVAALLEEIGQIDAAETMLRNYAEKGDTPHGAILLAAFLGRRNRLDEGLRLCETAWPSCPAEEVADTLLGMMASGKPNPSHYEAAVKQLDLAQARNPKKTALMSAKATLRRLQGNLDGAIETYRSALALDADNPLALNNLAWILALKKGHTDEAMEMMQRAIRLHGPSPAFLDTRGVIHILRNEPQLAVRDLDVVVQESPTYVHYFHLAQAHSLAGNRASAARAWTKARSLGLQETNVDILEVLAFQKLRHDLD